MIDSRLKVCSSVLFKPLTLVLDYLHHKDPELRLCASRWLQANRTYCAIVTPFLNVLFDVSLEFKEMTLDNSIEIIGHFSSPLDFSRVNYCIHSIHNLITFSPKNVLRAFSSKVNTESYIINSITHPSISKNLNTILDHIIFISSLYVILNR